MTESALTQEQCPCGSFSPCDCDGHCSCAIEARHGRAEDIAGISDMYGLYALELHPEHTEETLNAVKSTVSEILVDRIGNPVFYTGVLSQGGRILGFLLAETAHIPMAHDGVRDISVLGPTYTVIGHRNVMNTRTLFETYRKWCINTGIERIDTVSLLGNERALSRIGFELKGTVMKHDLKVAE